MNPFYIIAAIAGYFAILIAISRFTSHKSSNKDFYLGNRKSPWFVVAFGMLGASLSGVTFISVPGWVNSTQFSYLQMVLGYLVGYIVISYVLLPVYYKLNLTSIYTYLEHRFGIFSQKTGAIFFFISRVIGASFRLFIVATVLQVMVFDPLSVPFPVTVIITIALIWIYTNKGGIKTIIWTDVLQTTFMFLSAIFTIVFIANRMDIDGLWQFVQSSEYSKTFFFSDWNSPNHFFKQFFGGMFITIVMTGLDQDMMQKNLSCKNLKDAQKNMLSYGIAFIPVNIMFLTLGVLLYSYAGYIGLALPTRGDEIFPLVISHSSLPLFVVIFFILGLVAAAYSSADSALTALTTTFTVDILGYNHDKTNTPKALKMRQWSHIGISALLAIVIIIFRLISDDNVINAIFTVAGYTYGPLLGLFAYGLFTKRNPIEKWIPYISIGSPIICYILSANSEQWFNGYSFGFELLILNGALVFIGLHVSSFLPNKKSKT
ncbi:MAG: sodium:solute symporter [Salinivirgaceae bacterium]|jgi:SSS family solute:Na+ symporter|nr:sodium:solute symporter [Salinivirgaceae bacterium]